MLDEVDVRDDEDNIVIAPGLKVRHKASQYEYTVDAVTRGPGGEIQIILKMPEEPRFEPPPTTDKVMTDDWVREDILYEVDPESLFVAVDEEGPEDPGGQEEYLAISQDEFERDYEVK